MAGGSGSPPRSDPRVRPRRAGDTEVGLDHGPTASGNHRVLGTGEVEARRLRRAADGHLRAVAEELDLETLARWKGHGGGRGGVAQAGESEVRGPREEGGAMEEAAGVGGDNGDDGDSTHSAAVRWFA